MVDRCPCCWRAFEKIQDYPLVFVHRVERLPIPEFLDRWSADAAELQLRLREQRQDLHSHLSLGVNRTPEFAAAYQSEGVQEYLRHLESYQGLEVAPSELAPHLTPHRWFRWAYPIPGTRLFLSMSESEPQGGERICRIVFHGEGANLGSAGGPTLQEYGPVASIRYEGRMMEIEGEWSTLGKGDIAPEDRGDDG